MDDSEFLAGDLFDELSETAFGLPMEEDKSANDTILETRN
jgi:hypothetical protein